MATTLAVLILGAWILPNTMFQQGGGGDAVNMSSAEPNSFGQRPPLEAARRSAPPQRIPRRIYQTGYSFAAAMSVHSSFMAPWWQLNPEYEYAFYSDAAALRLVNTHASAAERQAYNAVVHGAQKADLFRIHALRYRGGVYADVDMELRKPLRSFVPSDTSAVIGRYWTTEFMAFEPNHPLLVEAAAKITANVHRQLQYIREGNTRRASHTSQTSFPARHKPKSPRFSHRCHTPRFPHGWPPDVFFHFLTH